MNSNSSKRKMITWRTLSRDCMSSWTDAVSAMATNKPGCAIAAVLNPPATEYAKPYTKYPTMGPQKKTHLLFVEVALKSLSLQKACMTTVDWEFDHDCSLSPKKEKEQCFEDMFRVNMSQSLHKPINDLLQVRSRNHFQNFRGTQENKSNVIGLSGDYVDHSNSLILGIWKV